ncbi:MAG: glycosyltransferase family 4 protein [Acidimicrobiaceae bacterium]|nr:glycosyltransferase family 4 protein [Acidimicrobiaceae bacterium]
MRIDQYVPGFAKHDAIGNHSLQIRSLLRGQGIESDIYGEWIDPRVASEARHYREARPTRGDVVIYHSSTHSSIVDWLLDRAAPGVTVLSDYHNITPSSYFRRWEPAAADSMDLARAEFERMAPVVSLAMADSQYNEKDLLAAGYGRTATAHLLVDLEEYHRAPDARTLERLRRQKARGGADWLFVGRIAPNKCQHDIIGAFAAYRRVFDPAARLTLVGGATAVRYLRALEQLTERLELGDSVTFADNVAFPALLAHFATADVFVCLSEHEGFCVPVLEAMELEVPVVAFDAAAVPETLAGTGVLLGDKDPWAVAVAVAELLADGDRRERLVAAARDRARELSLPVTSAALLRILTGWLAEAGLS